MVHKTLTTLGVLALTLMIAAPVAAHPTQWQLRNVYWDLAPEGLDGTLFGLRLETVAAGDEASDPLPHGSHGSITLFPEGNPTIEDLTTMALDVYYESGGCGGGSARMQLGLDLDGDGGRDKNVHVYAGPGPSYVGCPTGEWIHEDILAYEDPRWDTGQLAGGTFYDTRDDAHALAMAESGGDYSIVAFNLVWDSTWRFGSSVTWFDNVQIQDHTLSEPHSDPWCLVTPDGVGLGCVLFS